MIYDKFTAYSKYTNYLFQNYINLTIKYILILSLNDITTIWIINICTEKNVLQIAMIYFETQEEIQTLYLDSIP